MTNKHSHILHHRHNRRLIRTRTRHHSLHIQRLSPCPLILRTSRLSLDSIKRTRRFRLRTPNMILRLNMTRTFTNRHMSITRNITRLIIRRKASSTNQRLITSITSLLTSLMPRFKRITQIRQITNRRRRNQFTKPHMQTRRLMLTNLRRNNLSPLISLLLSLLHNNTQPMNLSRRSLRHRQQILKLTRTNM